MKYNIITEIEGVKKYVRRFNRKNKYCISVTMLCSTPYKAYNFETQEKASLALSLMGIGHAIETNE